MKILKIHLKNFKRFSDLLINHIPPTSRLILLIGSNGSGKSSLFDTFSCMNNIAKGDILTNKEYWRYYKKNVHDNTSIAIDFDDNDEISCVSVSDNQKINTQAKLNDIKFYGRSSFKHIPRLTRTALGQGSSLVEKDSDRPKFFIDRDCRLENDLERIIKIILEEAFNSSSNTSIDEIKEKYIEPINSAFDNVFANKNGTRLQFKKLIPPLEEKTAQLIFTKGVSEIHYDYLSAGEKEVFNLLFNLLARRKLYEKTIYFLDEVELHLNTKLQLNLLKEITENWIPENSQLWVATHSLGCIEYAKQAEHASIIDFSNLDFDLPQVLSPTAKDNSIVYENIIPVELSKTQWFKQEIEQLIKGI